MPATLAWSSVPARSRKVVSKSPALVRLVRGAKAPPSLFRDQAEEGGSGSSGLEQNMCSVYEAEVQGPEACWARLDGTLGSCSSLPGLLA